MFLDPNFDFSSFSNQTHAPVLDEISGHIHKTLKDSWDADRVNQTLRSQDSCQFSVVNLFYALYGENEEGGDEEEEQRDPLVWVERVFFILNLRTSS